MKKFNFKSIDIEAENVFRINEMKNGKTTILNKRIHHAAIKYAKKNNMLVICDRQSIYGNPYVMRSEAERSEVVKKFWYDIKNGKSKLTASNFNALHGKALLCWCAPLRCHCEALKFVANKLQDGLTLDEIKKL